MQRIEPLDGDQAELLLPISEGDSASSSAPELCETDPLAIDRMRSGRRVFILAGAAMFLAGCASTTRSARLPGPVWRIGQSSPAQTPYPTPKPSDPSVPSGVIARSRWAKGSPEQSLLNPMRPVQYITVHHDGTTPFYALDEMTSMARLESIRSAHRSQNWGDIGYHFAIDRAGRIYQCRALNYQGAHVKDHNEGNIGIVNLGNFDQQTPSDAQVRGLRTILATLQSQYRVPASRIRTHQEWAATACPGRSMQGYMNTLRSSGQLT